MAIHLQSNRAQPSKTIIDDLTSTTSHTTEPPPPNLMTLPTELHLMVASHLMYPDALSLKNTNTHFRNLVNTGIRLKVAWLMERRRLHLECPNDVKCDLGSDLRFCRGSVPILMRRRREHLECNSKPGIGCIIFGTEICTYKKNRRTFWNWIFDAKLTIGLHWVLLIVAMAVAGFAIWLL